MKLIKGPTAGTLMGEDKFGNRCETLVDIKAWPVPPCREAPSRSAFLLDNDA